MPLDEEDKLIVRIVVYIAAAAVLLIALMLWGCPQYGVWTEGLAGEAEFRRAEQNRRIAVEEARAKAEAAELLAQAEVVRATGVAQAQKIINQTLTDRYIQWMMADKLSEQASVVYVPTEAQIPLLEAGRSVKVPKSNIVWEGEPE